MQTTLQHDFSLTSPQSDIFFHQQQYPSSTFYNICGYYRLLGKLDVERFQAAFNQLALVADMFRLKFVHSEKWPKQCLSTPLNTRLPATDFSHASNPQTLAEQRGEQIFATQFDLVKGGLFKAELLSLSVHEHWFVLVGHHVVVDGWSCNLLFKKLLHIYTAIGKQDEPALELLLDLPQFTDTVEGNLRYQQGKAYQRSGQYWLDKFATPCELLFKPHYREHFEKNALVPSKRQHLSLSKTQAQQLGSFCRSHQSSPQSVFIAIAYAYFAGITVQNDMVIGIPLHNRTSAVQKDTIGMFTSMSPLRICAEQALSFTQLLQTISKTQRLDFRHQKFPIGHLNRELKQRNKQQSTLFDLSVNYLQLNVEDEFEGLSAEANFIGHGLSQIPLSINVVAFGNDHDIELQIDHNLAFWSEDEALLLMSRMIHVLDQLLANPDGPIAEVGFIPPAESAFIASHNHLSVPFDQSLSVKGMFEHYAQIKADDIAVVGGQQQLSFADLNRQANQLAHYLQNQGLGVGSRIGICTEPTVNMIIAVLAVFKAGAFYVPLDGSFVQQRLDFMVADSAIEYLLTESDLMGLFAHLEVPQLALDLTQTRLLLDQQSSDNLTTEYDPAHLAYLIYTSGSTGQPKGVMVEHANLLNYLLGVRHKHQLVDEMSYGVLSTLATDLGNTSLYLALISGGKLVLLPEKVTRDSHQFAHHLQANPIDVIKITPSHAHITHQNDWG